MKMVNLVIVLILIIRSNADDYWDKTIRTSIKTRVKEKCGNQNQVEVLSNIINKANAIEDSGHGITFGCLLGWSEQHVEVQKCMDEITVDMSGKEPDGYDIMSHRFNLHYYICKYIDESKQCNQISKNHCTQDELDKINRYTEEFLKSAVLPPKWYSICALLEEDSPQTPSNPF